MENYHDFLKPSIKEIRKSIVDIDDSYNNDWDILAELCQNSIDAIRKKNISNGKINIEINALKKSITVEDNGIGIDPDQLLILLAPFSSNKEHDESSIGEKGVGLTFVLFSCNDFRIHSGNENGSSIGKIKDALNWKKSSCNDSVKIQLEKPTEEIHGTKVILNEIGDIPLFKLTFEQIKYILRTRTAIGDTLSLWNDNYENKIQVYLKFTNLDGEQFHEDLKNKYWLIHESIDNHAKIDLDEFIAFANDADRTDQEKRKKLQDKIIYKKGLFNYNGRTIKYYTCFVPKRRVWEDLSVETYKLCTVENLNMDNTNGNTWYDDFGYTIFSSGIYTSVKGMPTGISIEHPSTGYAGYWSNIFILFEDAHLKFDIGRKSIHGMISRIYKNFAKEIFNEYLKYITKYVSGEITTNSDWDKEEVFAEIDSIIDLNRKNSLFKKTPRDQEASVSAIFYELIGNKTIQNIIPLISGYRNKYDLYAKWNHKKIVVEFKAKLRNILKDFNDEQKLFNEIDLIVCWNVNEEDNQAMKNKGITLEKITTSILSDNSKKVIPHSTHEIILSGFTKPIYIIDLEKLV